MHSFSSYTLLLSVLAVSPALGTVVDITSQQQLDEIIKNNTFVILKVSADWCSACAQIKKPFADAANDPEFSDIVLANLNLDSHPSIAQRYNVDSLPTFLYFVQGELVDTKVGASTAFKREIRQFKANHAAGKKNETAATKGGKVKNFLEEMYDSIKDFFISAGNTISSWFN